MESRNCCACIWGVFFTFVVVATDILLYPSAARSGNQGLLIGLSIPIWVLSCLFVPLCCYNEKTPVQRQMSGAAIQPSNHVVIPIRPILSGRIDQLNLYPENG